MTKTHGETMIIPTYASNIDEKTLPTKNFGPIGSRRQIARSSMNGNHHTGHTGHIGGTQNLYAALTNNNLPAMSQSANGYQSYGANTSQNMHHNQNIPFSPYSMHQPTLPTQQLNGQSTQQLLGQHPQQQTMIRPPPGFGAGLYRTTSQGFIAPETLDSVVNDFGQMDVTPSPIPASGSVWSTGSPIPTVDDSLTNGLDLDSDSDDDCNSSHPNKYPVEIEEHFTKACGYRRQPTRSGPKIKQRNVTSYDPVTYEQRIEPHQIKYYQKDIVRICRCGRYPQMDGALTHGRSNDCDGYEIHYNQKCKWKAYDDFKTGKRVLIRLCKCYKPSL